MATSVNILVSSNSVSRAPDVSTVSLSQNTDSSTLTQTQLLPLVQGTCSRTLLFLPTGVQEFCHDNPDFSHDRPKPLLWSSRTSGMIILNICYDHPEVLLWSSRGSAMIIQNFCHDHPEPLLWSSRSSTMIIQNFCHVRSELLQWSSRTSAMMVTNICHDCAENLLWSSRTSAMFVQNLCNDHPELLPRSSRTSTMIVLNICHDHAEHLLWSSRTSPMIVQWGRCEHSHWFYWDSRKWLYPVSVSLEEVMEAVGEKLKKQTRSKTTGCRKYVGGNPSRCGNAPSMFTKNKKHPTVQLPLLVNIISPQQLASQ